jgi:pimeloyl-ACP methyl ester carboxylesterase
MTRYLFLCLLVSYQSLAQTFTSFDGTKIYYETLGQGRPVVLLHGFIVDSNTWKRGKLPDLLAANGFKVILIDLRGNGLSDRPQQLAAYQQDAEIKDVMALMQWLGYSQYDVVGYSRGAILAARELVIDSHVRSAVLGGMGSDFTNPAWARRVMFAEAFGGKAHLHPETAGAIRYAKSIGADTLVLGYLQQVQPATSAKQLGQIKKPVLVISGEQDTDNGPAAALAALIPQNTLVTVPGNHNNTSQSQDFAEAVLQFLKNH